MNKEHLKETESGMATNTMGSSSSVGGSGPIDTYDPLLQNFSKKDPDKIKKKLRNIVPK